MASQLSDIELIRQVLHENDSRAFGALMERYTARVLGAALRIVKDEENAAEVTQMAFIQAYKQLDSWRGENFGAWVTIIANHIALRLLERENRFRTGVSQSFGSDEIEKMADIPDEGYDEEKEQRLQSLEEAVNQLPEGDRQIIQWHYYENVPLAEIAARLGQTENNVKVRVFRIRERLKRKVKGEK
ncbi:MAG: sigma-70 family RNA polymerase sigma factor [Paludibacteraceae bacterium]|nr:sigma-70 family RNA polymerase sigma factor [Paludibacteraceae bacterium]